LCFSLTTILIIGLSIAWKFRSSSAMNARQMYAQNMMIILCYFVGVGFGISALVLNNGKGEEDYYKPSKLLFCITLCHWAAMDFYFYRVWMLYYKHKQQNEFEKVRKSSVELDQSTVLSHIRMLTSNLGTNMRNIEENKQTEKLIKLSRQQLSVRKSCFVRYRYTLGRSTVIQAFWFFFWICQSIVALWNFSNESVDSGRWAVNKLPLDCFIFIQMVICFVALFVYPSDDNFLIKFELRLIYLIIIVESVLLFTLLYCKGVIAAYLSLSVAELCIMVAITCTNYQALALKCSCFLDPICRHGSSFHDFDENSADKLMMVNILESKRLFQAFERHLKKEFSLEHLNFVVAIVYYKRLCAKRNHKPQNEYLKSREISMQHVRFTESKTSENVLNISNFSTATTQTTSIASSGMESELSMLPKDYSKPRRKKWSRCFSEVAPVLYWIKSDIEVWSDIQDTAFFIFEEYCVRGAPQEINIGRRERNELFEFFSGSLIDPAELCTIFDPPFDSVMDLLEKDSLRRFRRNSSFNKFVK